MDVRKIGKNEEGIYGSYVRQWCEKNGYSELQRTDGDWWAIPPGGFLPVPVGLIVRLAILEELGITCEAQQTA